MNYHKNIYVLLKSVRYGDIMKVRCRKVDNNVAQDVSMVRIIMPLGKER